MEVYKPQQTQHVSEHLANERTYLAWLRTSLSLLTLGFATSKFGEFLRTLHGKSEGEFSPSLMLGSYRFGVGMVILGTLVSAYSCLQYQQARKAIDTDSYRAPVKLIWFITIFSILFGITAIFLIFQT
jgi:putative membrane protein